jgi:hypothetical protein
VVHRNNDLMRVAATSKINLAAHLCGQHANNLIGGDATFVEVLLGYGFQRIQINARAVNGVDLSKLSNKLEAAYNIVRTSSHPSNSSCKKMKKLAHYGKNSQSQLLMMVYRNHFQKNITMLLDELKGTGKPMDMDHLQPPPLNFDLGYAGGIGPSHIKTVLQSIMSLATERSVWI